MNKRVVVTGLGVVSSIGIGKDAFWSALCQGKSGISEISSFDTSGFSTHYGGEIKDFSAQRFVPEHMRNTLGRASQLAVSAATLSLDDAGFDKSDLSREKFGVAIGTTMGESQVIEQINDTWVRKGIDAVNVSLLPQYPCNVLASNVAIAFSLRGPNTVIPTACAAGNYCIGFACDTIKQGAAEVMLAGGADAFSRIAFIGFNRLYAVAPQLCQPFDKNRKGMMVGEGGAVLVLESLEHALKRNAPIYAEILGYGLSCDAHHMTAPHAPGIAKSMEKALKESNISADAVDYISAHGTGTPANDKAECLAIHEVFGARTRSLKVSSIKSMLGHTMGAASAIEALTCCLAVKENIAPPTINFTTPDPECDIDCVPNKAQELSLDIALNNALAFGGNNACLVVKKYYPSK